LSGKSRVPADKSISTRLILGALSVGETRISGLLEGETSSIPPIDAGAGAKIEQTGAVCLAGHRRGRGGLRPAGLPLDFGNSGTGCRLVMGRSRGARSLRVRRDASLRSRPMRRILDPLELMGAKAVRARKAAACADAARRPRSRCPSWYRTPWPRPRFKSAVLLAGLAAPGVTTVIEQEASRDHTD